MISQVIASNFKSWSNLNLEVGSLTGLFGTNSSGKTSVIQVLLLLKQSIESTDRSQVLNFGDEKSYVNLGTFKDLVKDHNDQNHLELSLAFNFSSPVKVTDPLDPGSILFEGEKVHFSSVIRSDKSKGLYVESFIYRFGGYEFKMDCINGKGSSYELSATQFYEYNYDNFSLKEKFDFDREIPKPVKFYGFPDEINARFKNVEFLSKLQLELENQIRKIYYLGPLRDDPKRQYVWGGSTSEMGMKGGQVVDSILASKIRDLKISDDSKDRITVEEMVAYWMKKIGLIDSFRISEVVDGSSLYRVYVKRNPNSSEVLLPDVGFGVSQILPVIALCYSVPTGSTVILEQPEIHLHPKVQAGLGDVFIHAIQTRNIQIVVESHSEYLIRRLQRRIAEDEFSFEKTALYFCDNTDDGSNLSRLKIDDFGTIKNWPKDFFGDEMEEISMTALAALKKKRKQNGVSN